MKTVDPSAGASVVPEDAVVVFPDFVVVLGDDVVVIPSEGSLASKVVALNSVVSESESLLYVLLFAEE